MSKLILISTLLLFGCLQTPQMARNSSDYGLCEQVLVYGNTKYYNDELVRRNVNCQQYMPLLLQKQRQRNNLYNPNPPTNVIIIPRN